MVNQIKIPELDAKGYRDFAFITGLIVVALFGLFVPWLFDQSFPSGFPLWPWVVLLILSVWGFFNPMSLRPIYIGWMRFGLFMGTYIMTPLIMFLVFFGMFMPMGLVIRLFKNDLLKRKLDSKIESYRVPSSSPTAKNLEKPF
ncbi:MAG: sxtJ [Pseudomonadota bacterium]|nr:sxtJ [Pseudomonadota bacterium]